ncbi:hypothetical protein U1Q18_042896 [Sarracenia purpurea var. burkii]
MGKLRPTRNKPIGMKGAVEPLGLGTGNEEQGRQMSNNSLLQAKVMSEIEERKIGNGMKPLMRKKEPKKGRGSKRYKKALSSTAKWRRRRIRDGTLMCKKDQ